MRKKSLWMLVFLLLFVMAVQMPSEAKVKVKRGKEYLYSNSGKLLKNGLKKVDGKTYYVDKKGVIQKKWQTVGGKKYYFNNKGVMQTGWKTIGKKTYFFSGSSNPKRRGIMVTGWKTIKKKKYYFDRTGELVTKKWVDCKYVNGRGQFVKNKKSSIGTLKKRVEEYIRTSCVGGTWSVYAKNLDSGEYFSINNQSMTPGCTIKMFAMAAAFEQIEQGKFTYESVQHLIYPMITVSSNEAFNSLIRVIGISAVNDFCKRYGYTQTNQGNGISPAYNAAGISNGSGGNRTSVEDLGKLLEDMYTGYSVSKSASRHMLAILKEQQLTSKLPSGVPSGIAVGNKTGSTGAYSHDAAIVFGPKATYVLCIMTNTVNPGGVTSGFQGISNMVYYHFN